MNMNRIYKYELSPTDRQVLNLPKGTEILSVIDQWNDIVLYALIDENFVHDTEPFTFIIRGTGHDAGNFKRQNYIFLGTVKLQEGAVMLHVFYRKGD